MSCSKNGPCAVSKPSRQSSSHESARRRGNVSRCQSRRSKRWTKPCRLSRQSPCFSERSARVTLLVAPCFHVKSTRAGAIRRANQRSQRNRGDLDDDRQENESSESKDFLVLHSNFKLRMKN